MQTIAPTQITEHLLPRLIRHASLCSLLVGGMVVMAGAGTIIRVVDQYSGEPISRFSVVDASRSSYQGSMGEAHVPFSMAAHQLQVTAPGYRSATLQAPPMGDRRLSLAPLTASIVVRANGSDELLADAAIQADLMLSRVGPGEYRVWPATGSDLTVRAPGSIPNEYPLLMVKQPSISAVSR